MSTDIILIKILENKIRFACLILFRVYIYVNYLLSIISWFVLLDRQTGRHKGADQAEKIKIFFEKNVFDFEISRFKVFSLARQIISSNYLFVFVIWQILDRYSWSIKFSVGTSFVAQIWSFGTGKLVALFLIVFNFSIKIMKRSKPRKLLEN